MNWRYRTLGIHTHVSVYVGGALCGSLCFRVEEFEEIRREHLGSGKIAFLDANAPSDADQLREAEGRVRQ